MYYDFDDVRIHVPCLLIFLYPKCLSGPPTLSNLLHGLDFAVLETEVRMEIVRGEEVIDFSIVEVSCNSFKLINCEFDVDLLLHLDSTLSLHKDRLVLGLLVENVVKESIIVALGVLVAGKFL